LDYALRVDVHGFWGGTTREDRKIIRKQTGMQYEPLTFQDMSKGKVDNSGRELTKSS
jgi:hypothetical protein